MQVIATATLSGSYAGTVAPCTATRGGRVPAVGLPACAQQEPGLAVCTIIQKFDREN